LNTVNNIIHDSDKEMFRKQEQIKQSNSVSNKEALRDKIHEIHNYLRNSGAGYGMTALKIFNILYGLKKIEDTNSFEQLGLGNECKFSDLLELAEENKDETLAEYIYNNVLDYIYESNPMVKKLIYYDIPKHIKSSVFSHLVKEINKIPIIETASNVLLSGKIYEYFVGRDQTAISELGAYFTDRHIVDYIYSKVDPEIKEDGTIRSMVDMFGGSGGFTTGYIDYLNKKYPDINWKSELDKIYHFDMNNDVIKSAGLEFFCLTGVIPNMDDNIRCINSFKDSFNDRKFFYPITNPPYGGDKRTKTQEAEKRKKVKDYIKKELKTLTDEATIHRRQLQLKQIEKTDKKEKKEFDKQKVCLDTCHYAGQKSRIKNFAKKYNIKNGNDKESCSLMLIMDMVEFGGTAVGVLKEGVFFNKAYKDLRKVLIERFNVREVISVPSDQFENTSTKTSIVIFDNLGEEKTTNQVIFSDLVVEKFTEDTFEEILGEIALIECKDDIKGVVDKVVSTATREEILANPICSLNGKDYNKQEIVCSEDYKLVKLDNICEFLPKSKRSASFAKIEGSFNFYTSSNTIKKCDIADYKDECLIIGDGGQANIQKDINFSCSDHNHIIKTDKNDYIYYLFQGNMNLLSDGFSGSVLKNLSKTYLKSIKIPIPKTPEKLQYWVDRISAPYEENNQKLKEIDELEKKVQDRIQEIMDTGECEEKELGEICDIEYGKRITKKRNEGTIYTAYGGGNIMSYKVDEFNRDGVTYKISRDGISHKNCVSKIYGKIFLNDTAFTLKSKFKNIKDYYIGEFLLKKKDFIYKNCTHGSAQLHIDLDRLMKIKIPIPTNPEIIKAMEPDFQRIEQLQGEVKEAEELYQQYIQELAKEAIPPELNQPQEVVVEEVKREVNLDTISETSSEIEEEKDETVKDYSTYATKELKTFCKERGLKGYSKLTKDELIELLKS